MDHLPLFADVKHRACLVVGGGPVAERRVKWLLGAGAEITVVAPRPTDTLRALADRGAIEIRPAAFADQSLDEFWLIVAASNDAGVNAAVARAAERAKRFCNVVDDPKRCSFIVPAIVDREPVTVAISSGGHAPVLARSVKGIVEAALPARLGALGRLAGAWRERVKQALPDAESRRKFWQQVLHGEVAEHAFAGRSEHSEAALEAALAAWRDGDAAGRRGEAYLVGAGPGSPDLMTLRGRQLLAQADVVLYDRLVHPATLDYARRDAELISVAKTPRRLSISQAQLNRLLVQLVASGKTVCRLKGGDPMVFGRAGEEMEALTQAGLPFQIVPGVSAVEGCAAYAGIPLTLRGMSKTVLITTGHAAEADPRDLASFRPGQTLALYMGVAQFGAIGETLLRNGHDPDTPAAIVENGTTDEQRVILIRLAELRDARERHGVSTPALLLVGETVRYAERYNWFNPSGTKNLSENPSLARVS